MSAAERGVAHARLIGSVAVVAAITTVVMTGSVIGLLEDDVVRAPLDQLRARALADSGVEHGLAALRAAATENELAALLFGPDGLRGTADDGRLLGPHPWVLESGSYHVHLAPRARAIDEPDDGGLVLLSTGRAGGALTTVRIALEREPGSVAYRVAGWRRLS